MIEHPGIAVRGASDARALYGAAPVPGAVPAGADVRDAADFEQLEAEVRRMEVDGPAAVDWRKVCKLSLHILANQSKDILIACWAVYGLFRIEGYQGLAVGLAILRGMMDVHWDGLYPPIKRERARVGAVDWLVGRLGPAVAETAAIEADYPAVLAAYEALDDLDHQFGDKLVNEHVVLGELFRALKPHYKEAKRAGAEAEDRVADAVCAAEETSAAPAKARPPADGPQHAVPHRAVLGGVDGDWAEFTERLPDMLRQAAAAVRAASPTNPKAYLLNRVGSWMRFDALPPDSGGRTEIFPPADSIVALEVKVVAGQHADVVNLAEEIAWTGPFWLDAHRHAAEALEQMGPSFEAAATVVRGAVTMLVTRYPRILEFHFNNGRPFADDETRAWAAAVIDATAGPDPVEEAVADAYKLIGEGQPQAALERLSRALDGAICERARFVGQLAQARFCVDTGFVTTAVPLLDHIEGVVAKRDLESWEPALALEAAELRFRAMTHSESQQMIDEPRRRLALEQIRMRAARIDIARASRLGRG